MIRIIVPGPPVSTNQGYQPARWGKRHGLVLTPEGEAYKAKLLAAARQAWSRASRPPPLDAAAVRIRYVFRTLGSDIDGPIKFSLDALQPGGLVVNDNRVRRLYVEKLDPDGEPRTEIEVRPVGEVCPACGCWCGGRLPNLEDDLAGQGVR